MKSPRLKDFPIDHRLMNVADTLEMVAIQRQISALLIEYHELREHEQRRFFSAFLRTVRDKAIARTERSYSWLRNYD